MGPLSLGVAVLCAALGARAHQPVLLRIVYPPHDGFFLFRNVEVALTIQAQQAENDRGALRCVECSVNDTPLGRVCGKNLFSLSFDTNMTGPIAAVTAELYEERDGAVELLDATSGSFRLIGDDMPQPHTNDLGQGTLVDCDLGPFEGALFLQGFAGRHAGGCVQPMLQRFRARPSSRVDARAAAFGAADFRTCASTMLAACSFSCPARA